ncbi:MAG TPA: sigma-70 family RNA polymerase sigma factor [Tepidisphaeraceae bacterium]|nr:sigma-70 family RNA polymerase sigma factor [Tepidisphaeraceae bacterium]
MQDQQRTDDIAAEPTQTDTLRIDPDMDLFRKAASGDGKAFHQLVDRHAQRLYRLAVSLVGNGADAEDVLQETFAGAYRGLSRFEGRSSVKTWLTRILMTQAARWRRDRRRRRVEAVDPAGLEISSEGGQAASGRKIDLQAALQLLTPEHRQVLVLREFEQLSYDQIAEVLDVPRGTVESRLHRARGELREKLRAYLE